MLDSERLSGAAHSRHNFVGNQKDTVPEADFRDALGVTVGRHGGAESGTDDQFEHESCGLTGSVFAEKDFEIVGANELALRKSLFERTEIGRASCRERGSNAGG